MNKVNRIEQVDNNLQKLLSLDEVKYQETKSKGKALVSTLTDEQKELYIDFILSYNDYMNIKKEIYLATKLKEF